MCHQQLFSTDAFAVLNAIEKNKNASIEKYWKVGEINLVVHNGCSIHASAKKESSEKFVGRKIIVILGHSTEMQFRGSKRVFSLQWSAVGLQRINIITSSICFETTSIIIPSNRMADAKNICWFSTHRKMSQISLFPHSVSKITASINELWWMRASFGPTLSQPAKTGVSMSHSINVLAILCEYIQQTLFINQCVFLSLFSLVKHIPPLRMVMHVIARANMKQTLMFDVRIRTHLYRSQ